MGERIGMDISNMIWDRCVNIIENNDYQGCKEGFIEVMAMEVPFTEDEMNSMKREDLCEKAFQAAMERFQAKRRICWLLWPSLSSNRCMRHKGTCMRTSWCP